MTIEKFIDHALETFEDVRGIPGGGPEWSVPPFLPNSIVLYLRPIALSFEKLLFFTTKTIVLPMPLDLDNIKI